jgi:hypothetical protein
MRPLSKGLLLALLQVLLVCTLGVKLLYDRAHRPRLWIKVATYDPNLPIRGRYLAINLELPSEGFSSHMEPSLYPMKGQPNMHEVFSAYRCDLVLRDRQLIAVANNDGEFFVNLRHQDDKLVATVSGDMAYFLPEHANIPFSFQHPNNEELWVEATVPRKGPPRPIRLGIKKDSVLTPLALD